MASSNFCEILKKKNHPPLHITIATYRHFKNFLVSIYGCISMEFMWFPCNCFSSLLPKQGLRLIIYKSIKPVFYILCYYVVMEYADNTERPFFKSTFGKSSQEDAPSHLRAPSIITPTNPLSASVDCPGNFPLLHASKETHPKLHTRSNAPRRSHDYRQIYQMHQSGIHLY